MRVEIGTYHLYVPGFYYPEDQRITHSAPRRDLSEKFLLGTIATVPAI